jgi:hypothetical protein
LAEGPLKAEIIQASYRELERKPLEPSSGTQSSRWQMTWLVYADNTQRNENARAFARNESTLAFRTLAQTIVVRFHLCSAVWTLWTTTLGHYFTSSSTLFFISVRSLVILLVVFKEEEKMGRSLRLERSTSAGRT